MLSGGGVLQRDQQRTRVPIDMSMRKAVQQRLTAWALISTSGLSTRTFALRAPPRITSQPLVLTALPRDPANRLAVNGLTVQALLGTNRFSAS